MMGQKGARNQSALIILFLSVFISGCHYQPIEKKFAHFQNNDFEIVKSYHRITSEAIYFMRLLGKGADAVLLQGSISIDETSPIVQTLSSNETLEISASTVDSITKMAQGSGFVVDSVFSQEVILVQVVPDSALDNLNALRFSTFRHRLEGKFGAELSKNENGHWLSSELGISGANMLYEVKDWNKALISIEDVLAKEGVQEDALIARRIWLSEDAWIYEIVFPREYEGVFYSN
ncbi:MAG: hypothetical protein ACI9UR_001440 [Bacteroidia bacterium]|jgi:hypothetical protein